MFAQFYYDHLSYDHLCVLDVVSSGGSHKVSVVSGQQETFTSFIRRSKRLDLVFMNPDG